MSWNLILLHRLEPTSLSTYYYFVVDEGVIVSKDIVFLTQSWDPMLSLDSMHGMLTPRNNVMWVGEVVDNHGRFMTFYKSHDEVF